MSVWDWLKALTPLRIPNFARVQGLCSNPDLKQDLKACALSLSHLTFVTTFRTFHFLGSPSFPV